MPLDCHNIEADWVTVVSHNAEDLRSMQVEPSNALVAHLALCVRHALCYCFYYPSLTAGCARASIHVTETHLMRIAGRIQ